eukprot:14917448-Alexandrium_andersonii.AAC.1
MFARRDASWAPGSVGSWWSCSSRRGICNARWEVAKRSSVGWASGAAARPCSWTLANIPANL